MRMHYTDFRGNFLPDFQGEFAGIAKEEAAILAKSPFFWRLLLDSLYRFVS